MATTLSPTRSPSDAQPASPDTAAWAPRGTGSRRGLGPAYRWSTALTGVALVASAVGVFAPGVFRDAAMTAGNARGTDLAILAVALPTMLLAMRQTARGSLRAPIVWLGALAYVLYNAVFFAYGAHFNALFLLYAATLSLALWSVVALLRVVDVEAVRAGFAPNTPIRLVAGYLLLTTALFALLWLKDILPAIVANGAPASLKGTGMVTNPVEMTDFAFGFPLAVLSAVWLWQRRAWGYLLAGAFLVYGVLEAVSVAADQTFGHLSDPTASASMVPVFIVLALIGLVPTALYLGHLAHRAPPVRG